MGFWKIGFLFCICWCQIHTALISNKVCPNNSSYIFGDACYSLNVDHEHSYSDAVGFCHKQGGTLWSRTGEKELEFLKKVHVKIRRLYWIGLRQVGLSWRYLSDNSLASDTLFYKPTSAIDHCFYIKTGGNLASLHCQHEIYTVCEYTGAKCDAKKAENKDCYEFSDTPESFASAAKTCKSLGARIAEFRDIMQLLHLRDALWRNREFDDMPVEKIKVSVGSWLPTIWNFKYPVQNEQSCEVYLMKMILKHGCTESLSFACKFDAISAKAVTLSTSTTITSTTSASTTIPSTTSASTTKVISLKASETTKTKYSSTTPEQSSVNQQTENATSVVTSASTYETGQTSIASGNGEIEGTMSSLQTMHSYIIPIIVVATIIIIGIAIIIILQIKILRKKRQVRNENVYLEPVPPAFKTIDPARRNLPNTPTSTNNLYCDYPGGNDYEYEPLRTPDGK